MSDVFLLLLTATIKPADGVNISRKDPDVRRADYLQAFHYWLDHPDERIRHILFVENSDADLSEFKALADQSDKQVEFVSIPPNPPPPEMHYGYSEFQMMDQALEQSLLRNKTTHLIKATGRLIFPSWPRLLTRLPQNFQLAVDARARLPFRPSERGFISVQFFLARHDFYDAHLRRSYQQLQRSFQYPNQMEHLFFELLTPLKGSEGVLLRFPVNCEPVGFPAHKTGRYDNARGLITGRARAVFRVVAPHFWF